jgi:hypothetical protein
MESHGRCAFRSSALVILMAGKSVSKWTFAAMLLEEARGDTRTPQFCRSVHRHCSDVHRTQVTDGLILLIAVAVMMAHENAQRQWDNFLVTVGDHKHPA